MKSIKLFGLEILSWGEMAKVPDINVGALPTNRSSSPPDSVGIAFLQNGLNVIEPAFLWETIPLIRNLAYYNENVSQALDNLVQLGNTGHTVKFDAGVNEAEANKMIAHLDHRKLQWADGTAGMDGLVNKMIAQIMISGALSNEWVPNDTLTGVDRCILVDPETIRFVYDLRKQKYIPYQKQTKAGVVVVNGSDLKKLNQETYKYYAINGDREIPYGIPPYLPAINALARQKKMLTNIDYLVEVVGLLGFLTVELEKPTKETNENLAVYKARLETWLDEASTRLKAGFKDGMVIGFKEDSEFDFKSFTKDLAGVRELFENNELQILSGLKQDGSLLGRPYSTTEGQITVIFTKLLSQLKNIQALIKRNLEFGYTLDLKLAGFNFKSLHVHFNQSTVLDELKFQQALEIKIRNESDLYYDGITSIDKYANNLGYEKADQREVRFLRNKVTPLAEAKQKREEQKDKSDKRVRDKNKPQEKSRK